MAVIGTGAMGSAALWRLAVRGAAPVGFDCFDPPHDRGSSHGESRVFRTAYFEGPEYVPLAQHALTLWRRLEADTGADLLTLTGALMIGRPDSETVAGSLLSARTYHLAHEIIDAQAMRERFPRHCLAPDDVAVLEETAGFVRPEAAIAAALSRAQELGARILPETAIQDIAVKGDRVLIELPDRTIRARHAVLSVGAWLGRLLPLLNLPLQIERQVLVWVPVECPEGFSPERFPVFAHELPGGRLRYGLPSLDGQTIKIAIHHEGETTTADTIDRSVRAADLEPLRAFVRERLQGVGWPPERVAVCMYSNTPDSHFLIGSPPGMPNITVLGGFSGHGFKFAPVIGDIAADLALSGTTDYPIELFALDRFKA